MTTPRSHAITVKAEGIQRLLITDIEISLPDATDKTKAKAIWDTGASGSVITEKVAKDLGLISTGVTKVNTASEIGVETPTYVIDLWLKPDLRVPSLTVSEGTLGGDFECLIGMDIIGAGDFAVTNLNGKTTMSYRYPSQARIDFVKEINDNQGESKQIQERDKFLNRSRKKRKQR